MRLAENERGLFDTTDHKLVIPVIHFRVHVLISLSNVSEAPTDLQCLIVQFSGKCHVWTWSDFRTAIFHGILSTFLIDFGPF